MVCLGLDSITTGASETVLKDIGGLIAIDAASDIFLSVERGTFSFRIGDVETSMESSHSYAITRLLRPSSFDRKKCT
jgi:hypothetical protein